MTDTQYWIEAADVCCDDCEAKHECAEEESQYDCSQVQDMANELIEKAKEREIEKHNSFEL